MIEYCIVTVDTNHGDYRVDRIFANDIDTCAADAVRFRSDSRLVVAVIEADHYLAGVAAAFE